MRGDELERLISRAFAENARVKPQEIAAKLKVNVTRSPIDYDTVLGPAIDELSSIRISPALATRVGLDEFSEYEFWYDRWQESVHYTIVGPFQGSPQDQLMTWMLRFRTKVEEWLKGRSATRQ
jgi:hypothetical protein